MVQKSLFLVATRVSVAVRDNVSHDSEGRNILDIEDADGVHPAQAMVDLLKSEDEGWVSYQWPRPGDEKPSRKEAFVRKVIVDGEELVVGAGVYHD